MESEIIESSLLRWNTKFLKNPYYHKWDRNRIYILSFFRSVMHIWSWAEFLEKMVGICSFSPNSSQNLIGRTLIWQWHENILFCRELACSAYCRRSAKNANGKKYLSLDHNHKTGSDSTYLVLSGDKMKIFCVFYPVMNLLILLTFHWYKIGTLS